MCPKDYYKVLEVDYDATDEKMRLNYRRLALVSHIYLFCLVHGSMVLLNYLIVAIVH